ncbi:MAG: hypothetical protein ABS58_14630 [Mesorhizobium sp. SCN 65-20]|nr:MAG: hypothetical protein ABS58_14630 [Mesorhizobium sp. SCN 65-20]
MTSESVDRSDTGEARRITATPLGCCSLETVKCSGQFRLFSAKIEDRERDMGPIPSCQFRHAQELEQGRFEREPALFQIIHVIRP